jgi:hypothetical protein
MQRNPIPAVLLTAALSACALQSEALNSERIKSRFGSYGVEIVAQDGNARRSNLYSVHEGNKICRTFAIVEFDSNSTVAIPDIHSRVVSGASIGATLKDAGWEIRKETLYIGTLPTPTHEHLLHLLMQVPPGTELAVHAYDLHVEKSSSSVHYATIIETHHPDYLDEAELLELYPVTDNADEREIHRIRQLVLATGQD